jgi:hypothetical protein
VGFGNGTAEFLEENDAGNREAVAEELKPIGLTLGELEKKRTILATLAVRRNEISKDL